MTRVLLVAGLVFLHASCSGDRTDGADVEEAPGAASTTAPCVMGDGAQVTGDGVGAVVIGDPVDRVRLRCPVVGDTTLFLEGMPQPALLVGVGSNTVLAEVV